MIMKAEIEFTPPIEATPQQIREWAEFCLGVRGDISIENPLHEYDLECNDVTIY